MLFMTKFVIKNFYDICNENCNENINGNSNEFANVSNAIPYKIFKGNSNGISKKIF